MFDESNSTPRLRPRHNYRTRQIVAANSMLIQIQILALPGDETLIRVTKMFHRVVGVDPFHNGPPSGRRSSSILPVVMNTSSPSLALVAAR